MLKANLESMGSLFLRVAYSVGEMTMWAILMLKYLFKGHFDRDECVRSMYYFGYLSFVVVAISAACAGIVMVLQAAYYVKQFGAQSLIGWASGFVTLREMGPLLIALMFSGRVGAQNTAELATMKITEQLDAFRILTLDPFRYLFVPRLVAIVTTIFFLTIIGDAIALGSGALVARLILQVDIRVYFQAFHDFVHLRDLWIGLAKAIFFGFHIGIVSSYCSNFAQHRAKDVGIAVNNSVVISAIAIFVTDNIISTIFVRL